MTNTASPIRPNEHRGRGLILDESLKPGTKLDCDGMRIIRVSRYEVTGAPEYQPSIWTAIEFEAGEQSAAVLANQLADSLLEPAWYVNWNSDSEATVVFPNKVFRYRRGDQGGRAAAQQYGRQCGVPESQLDWAD